MTSTLKVPALARRAATKLVEQYNEHRSGLTKSSSTFNEAQTRVQFIDPMLEALGWDVRNTAGKAPAMRDVIPEATIVDDAEEDEMLGKVPDYSLQVGGRLEVYVEAKKPSVRIRHDKKPGFQTRRYGWTMALGTSMLTNFDSWIVYDCGKAPDPDDHPLGAAIAEFSVEDLIDRFDEFYRLLSFDAVRGGSLRRNEISARSAGAVPFDQYFLDTMEEWRDKLAQDIAQRPPPLSGQQITESIQILISRLIFLRVCQARGQEPREALEGIASYRQLRALFKEAEMKYNSSVFQLASDILGADDHVGGPVIVQIIKDLHSDKSPYDFSVIDSRILGRIYENFITRRVVRHGEGDTISIEYKPEVVASNGTVATPVAVAERMVDTTHIEEAAELSHAFRILDPCFGSGTFLVAAYRRLLSTYLKHYMKSADEHIGTGRLIDATSGPRLSLDEKRRLLLIHIFGVDQDHQAVEAARFALLLTMLEGESRQSIDSGKTPVLPSLANNIQHGNTLVDENEFRKFNPDLLKDMSVAMRIVPLTWAERFPEAMADGGFHLILGNPPYIRIQKMESYAREEKQYLQHPDSPYSVAYRSNVDKYYLFIERALSLVRPGGQIRFIVQHKFMTAASGRALRALLVGKKCLSFIHHFGTLQVFPGKLTYVCVLGLEAGADLDAVSVTYVGDIEEWARGEEFPTETYALTEIGDGRWPIGTLSDGLSVADYEGILPCLDTVADVFVGLQTSQDGVYVLKDPRITGGEVHFKSEDGVEWRVEEAATRPFLYKVTIPAFGVPRPNARLVFPYEEKANGAELIPIEEFSAAYPLAYAYLLAHKSKLDERSMQPSARPEDWHAFGRSQSLRRLTGETWVVWNILARSAHYGLDPECSLVSGGGSGPYYLLRPKNDGPLSMQALLAILHHPMVEAYVRSRADFFQGNYYTHKKQDLTPIPVPVPEKPTEKWKKQLSLVEKGSAELIDLADAVSKAVGVKRETLDSQFQKRKLALDGDVALLYEAASENAEETAE